MSIAKPSSPTREIRTYLTRPAALAVQSGIAIVLGLSGPFGTLGTLALVPRLSYWFAIVFGSFALGVILSRYLLVSLCLNQHTRWGRLLICGGISGTVISVFVIIINIFVFGVGTLSVPGLITLYCVALLVTFVVVALTQSNTRSEDAQPPDSPFLLDRLPLDKRGTLVSLSVSDHYVSVVTLRGTELLLMRLSDAIRESSPVDGLQVHRSHWIAKDQVQKARRKGEGALLTMSAGPDIPVSRSKLASAQDAGLLPKPNRRKQSW